MSNTLTPSGLQSSAGLYGSCGVYQFDRNGAIFNPLDLNPYLLFDAESSMIGTLENPTLDLDPTKQESLDVITATRAGTATFTDVNGLIASAPANTVRVDYVDGVPMILVEPSSVNLVDYSEALGSNSFAKVGTTIDSNVTVSPDGTASADLLKETDASGSHFMYKDLTLSSGQAYTISVFAKRNGVDRDLRFGDGGLGWSSGFNATFDLTEGTATSGGTIENIGNDWYRCSVTGTTNATTARLIVYSTLNGAPSYQGDGESGIYLWGFQIETGSVATSYIPTSGGNAAARTRAADDLKITGSSFSDFYNGSEGTFYLEAIDRDPTSGTHSFLRGQSEHRDFLFKYNGTSIHSFDGSTGVSQSGISANQLFRAAVSFKSGSRTLSLNGTSPAAVSLNTNWTTADRLRIGNGNAVVANTHVKRVIFWPYHTDNL